MQKPVSKHKKQVIIYVPGLGDTLAWLVWLQKTALSLWRVYGVRVEVITMRWIDPIPLEPRFKVLLSHIDQLYGEGKGVSLIGTSAGASAVIAAYAERPEKITGVVTICGKIQGDIPDSVKELNPSFAESLKQLKKALQKLTSAQKKHILTIYSPLDAVVPPREALLPGSKKLETKALGHNPTCAYVLLFKAREVTQFLKKLTNNK